MNKHDIFRDTKEFYLTNENISPNLIKFTTNHAGKKILDIGCATGEYCKKLSEIGFKCTGVDINPEYILKAKQKGIDAHIMDGETLDFPNNSFDTVILFEVLEHVNNPKIVLKEAKRVAGKNVLISVPNCTEFTLLRAFNLTYDHFLDLDHINFFNKNDMEDLLSNCFNRFKVEEKELIGMNVVGLPKWVKLSLLLLNKLKIINIYYRLYAIAEANK